MKILDKYSLRFVLEKFIETGMFMSKPAWKKLVRKKIDDVVREEWYNRVTNDTFLSQFLYLHNVYEPYILWKISKVNSKLYKYCQSCIKFIGMMFSNYRLLSCPACHMLNNNQTEHTVLYCRATETCRRQLWQEICCTFGFDIFSKFKLLEPTEQLLSLFSSLNNILKDEEDIYQCQRIVLYLLNDMARHVSFKSFNIAE